MCVLFPSLMSSTYIASQPLGVLGSKFFQFHAVFGKNWLNNSFPHPPLALAHSSRGNPGSGTGYANLQRIIPFVYISRGMLSRYFLFMSAILLNFFVLIPKVSLRELFGLPSLAAHAQQFSLIFCDNI